MRFEKPTIDITRLLTPRSVAIIGASEDQEKFGGRLMKALTAHAFAGAIYPINASRRTVFGLRAYLSVRDLPQPPDVVMMAIPQKAVKATVEDCVAAGARVAIILTSRFADASPEGAALEAEIVATARRGNMRIIGPNCLGLISPAQKLALCASPALMTDHLLVGRIGLVSQSGALMTTMFDRAAARGIGFSHCFSIGNQSDMDLADFIDFLTADSDTDVICTYIEGLKDAQRFLAAAGRARAAGKRILTVKVGRTKAGAEAAYSHTASLAGSHEAFAAACRKAGILLMDDTDAMVLLAAILSTHGTRVCDAVTILTPSGGSGAVAADRLSDAGMRMAPIHPDVLPALSEIYQGAAARSNPLDIGISTTGNFEKAAGDTARVMLSSPHTGFLLVPLTTSPDIRRIADGVLNGSESAAAPDGRQPFLIVLQPGAAAAPAKETLLDRGAFFAESLDEAIRAIVGWSRAMACRGEAPGSFPIRPPGLDLAAVEALGLADKIDEDRAKQVLAAYGVPVNRGRLVTDAEHGRAAAAGLTAPFAVKVVSPEIVHKSDVGGVALSLQTPAEVEAAIGRMRGQLAKTMPDARIEGFLVQEMVRGEAEILIGARHDAQFGPQIMVGAGGVLVELLRDVEVAAAPVGADTAQEMIGRLSIAKLLAGYRGAPPLDMPALADAVSRISWLAHDLGPRIAELDVNPMIVGRAGAGCCAVDARILISEPHAER